MITGANVDTLPKKRGRKKKEVVTHITEDISNEIPENIIVTIQENKPELVAKKRGRKPKGGKLIIKQTELISSQPVISNIILHLKCSMQDLNVHNDIIKKLVTDPLIYNPTIPPNILTYNKKENSAFSMYDTEKQEMNDFAYSEFALKSSSKTKESNICQICNNMNMSEENNEGNDDIDINIKDINIKLKKLKIQMYKNANHEKKSACFWCTYEYDNPSCYIPKYEMDKEIFGYGSFCRPECAVAYLMKENIDDSTKFERYHLLNQIYSKVYNFKKNIKPAPNPFYLLDKFYGNLTIQEYRKLLKTEHMLLVVDKPMTRILPELHEDNEDFIINIYGGSNVQSNRGGVYKVKRESEKKQGPSKSSIIKDKFGITQ
jgi:hypothetical protein